VFRRTEDTEFGDERQVIRRQKRLSASMDAGILQSQISTEVNMVELKQRKYSGITLRPALARPDFRPLEVSAEQARSQPLGPLVQISKDDFVSAQLEIGEDLLAKDPPRLFPPFEERRAEVKIKDMQPPSGFQVDIRAEATSAFPGWHGKVVVAGAADRKAGEQCVSVGSSFVPAILANFRVESQFLGQVPRLMVFPMLAFNTNHFLQCDDIRVGVAQYAQNSIWPHAPIEAPAFVHVISSHSQALRA
jgi:hypothetical protein